jgi:hypothetical protein
MTTAPASCFTEELKAASNSLSALALRTHDIGYCWPGRVRGAARGYTKHSAPSDHRSHQNVAGYPVMILLPAVPPFEWLIPMLPLLTLIFA